MEIELGKTYLDRDGDKVRIICVDRADSAQSVIGLALDKDDGTEGLMVYTESGEFNPPNKSLNDLVSVYVDVGEGYYLLDPEKDEKREGDQFRHKSIGDRRWRDLGKNQTSGFFKESDYRRHIEEPKGYVDAVPELEVPDIEACHAVYPPRGGFPLTIMAVSAHKDFLGYVWEENEKEIITVHPVAYRGVDGRLWPNNIGGGEKEICKAVRFKV